MNRGDAGAHRSGHATSRVAWYVVPPVQRDLTIHVGPGLAAWTRRSDWTRVVAHRGTVRSDPTASWAVTRSGTLVRPTGVSLATLWDTRPDGEPSHDLVLATRRLL